MRGSTPPASARPGWQLGLPASVNRGQRSFKKQMAKTGYLDGSAMAATFNILRANDLIFSYVVSNWLMGQDPPAFDILAWNADNTRMPATMHAFYLRNFYLENRLAKGELTIAGEQIDLGRVTQQCYVVGAENDHIVPWGAAYATTQLVTGPVRFVLSSGGHIAGIVVGRLGSLVARQRRRVDRSAAHRQHGIPGAGEGTW